MKQKRTIQPLPAVLIGLVGLVFLTAGIAQAARAEAIPAQAQIAAHAQQLVLLQEATETPEPTEPYFDDEDPELRETFILMTFEPTATFPSGSISTLTPTVTETPSPTVSLTPAPSFTASVTTASPSASPSPSPSATATGTAPAASATATAPLAGTTPVLPVPGKTQEPRLDRAQLLSELLASKVRNLTEGEIGSLSGMIFDSLTGDPLYALVTPRSLLGMNRAAIPVPWAAFNLGGFGLYQPQPGVLLLPVEQHVLATAPSIDRRQWDRQSPPAGWDTGVEAYWQNYVPMIPVTGTAIFTSGEAMLIDSRMLRSGSVDVTSSTGETLSRVKDLVLNADGQVEYAVVLVDDFFGVGGRLAPVPWDRLVWSSGGWLILQGNPAALKAAPGYSSRSSLPEFNQDEWDREIRGYWNP